MGIVFQSDAFKTNASATATHVLLVGCGKYPGLSANQGSLKPLEAPKLSVEALATWFLSGPDAMPIGQALPPELAFYNPQAPLGSLAMLVSPGGSFTLPSGEVATYTRPTRENLNLAFRDWLTRLGGNPQSRGVFYFCGHGLSDGDTQYLIADDFMEDQFEPWRPVVHVSTTCQVAIRLTSATLAFWIDACMDFSEDLLNQLSGPRPLLDGPRSGMPKTRDWSLIRATTTNRKAFAPQHGVARFTSALLRSLKGHCGTRYGMDQHFSVGAADLHGGVADFLDLEQQALSSSERQVVGALGGDGSGTTALHVLEKSPLVHVEVDVDPAGYRPVASAFMENSLAPREVKLLTSGPATFSKVQGEWTCGALASSAQFPEQKDTRLLKRAVMSWKFPIP